MPQDADPAESLPAKSALPDILPRRSQESSSRWLTTPQPIKRIFDTFPLVTYAANELPQRFASSSSKHSLYVFTTAEGAKKKTPSFNPGCLKWQAYLQFQGVDFITIPSSNHASPIGALPFLLPAASTSSNRAPVPTTRLERWVGEAVANPSKGARKKSEKVTGKGSGGVESSEGDRNPRVENDADRRYDVYMSLLEHRIRNAYLYELYLCPRNFASVVRPFYIDTCTSNPLVRLVLSRQLRNAAESELLKQSATINQDALHRECHKAFGALSDLLGGDEYFFGHEEPGLFDAHVFAYTNTLLNEGLPWQDRKLQEDLRTRKNLVAHREKILGRYFPGR
ncbi:MAG: hypothetical protein Q9163_003179 [Psora crenata]